MPHYGLKAISIQIVRPFRDGAYFQIITDLAGYILDQIMIHNSGDSDIISMRAVALIIRIGSAIPPKRTSLLIRWLYDKRANVQ